MNRLIDLAGKLPGLFPTIQIFKAGEFHGWLRLFGSFCLFGWNQTNQMNEINQTNLLNQMNIFGDSFALSLTVSRNNRPFQTPQTDGPSAKIFASGICCRPRFSFCRAV